MSKDTPSGLRTWITVDQAAIQKNYQSFRDFIPKETDIMAVVKSNAYGHGLVPFDNKKKKLHVSWLGVDSMVEGLAIRKSGVTTPILNLGAVLESRLKEAFLQKISVTVSSFDGFRALKRARLPGLSIQVKVDTGMHRQGFDEKDLPEVLRVVSEGEGKFFTLTGLYTHFASAKNPAFPEYTHIQIEAFKRWKKAFNDQGFSPIAHAGATGGALLFPESHFDMVRIGIGMYGLWPSLPVRRAREENLALFPALSWYSVVVGVKEVPCGARVGYDLTETLTRDTRYAVIPIGYWHGYPRILSSIGEVMIHRMRARILGRISMDMMIVDITDIPDVSNGDKVTLIGGEAGSRISAEELALLGDSINYELVTRINPLIERIYQ